MKRKRFFASLLLFLFISCSDQKPNFDSSLTFVSTPIPGKLPYFMGENMDPYWPTAGQSGTDLKQIPEIQLTTHLNTSFNKNQFLGKYSLVTFFYAKCNGICPLITRNIINFYPKISSENDLQIVTISVNPEIDIVQELINFRKLYKITQTNWIFLTGSKEKIYDLARNQFNADVQMIKGQANLNDFVHTENIFLLDKKGFLRGVYRAKGSGDLERLLVELKTLKEEG